MIYLCYIIGSLAISLYISLLYVHSHFLLKIIWISGIKAYCAWLFFNACPRRGLSMDLELVSLGDNRSCTPKKPSMAEEKINNGLENSINLFLEQSLTQQRDEMMENFSQILRHLPIKADVFSLRSHFRGTTPFKVHTNFDILVF
jgi:hypothetical protein